MIIVIHCTFLDIRERVIDMVLDPLGILQETLFKCFHPFLTLLFLHLSFLTLSFLTFSLPS